MWALEAVTSIHLHLVSAHGTSRVVRSYALIVSLVLQACVIAG